MERITWTDFLQRFTWHQGEHITLVGPTGAGKTTLALAIIDRRTYQLVVATKPQDPLISELTGPRGYKLVREWPPLPPQEVPDYRKVCFWPPIEKPADVLAQRDAIRDMLESLYVTGGWTVYFDEVRYVTQYLKLAPAVELLWQQGRSLNLSIMAATQRPRFIPLSAYSQATHLFLWRDNDEENIRRLSGLGAANKVTVQYAVMNLGKHEVLYVNTRTGELYVTKVA